MEWYILDKNYVNYLSESDYRVGYVEYGDNHVKLHLGIILTFNDFNYYVPISSPKPKHMKMKNSVDFHKIYDGEQLLAVLNLNNMIPVPKCCANQLKYDEIDNYRTFVDETEKNNYIYLLQSELEVIISDEEVIKSKARKLRMKYECFPDSALAKRCCNFSLLENKCCEYYLYKLPLKEVAATNEVNM